MPRKPVKTRNSSLSDAELCRRNGWRRGTLLKGSEGYGMSVIVITAVGESSILAKLVKHGRKPTPNECEMSWTLHARNWSKAG